MALSRIFNAANMSFKAIHENKILAKISEFSVHNLPQVCILNNLVQAILVPFVSFTAGFTNTGKLILRLFSCAEYY